MSRARAQPCEDLRFTIERSAHYTSCRVALRRSRDGHCNKRHLRWARLLCKTTWKPYHPDHLLLLMLFSRNKTRAPAEVDPSVRHTYSVQKKKNNLCIYYIIIYYPYTISRRDGVTLFRNFIRYRRKCVFSKKKKKRKKSQCLDIYYCRIHSGERTNISRS